MEEINSDGQPGAGDFRLTAHASIPGFSGRNDRVWVSAQAWRHFLDDLRALEARRSGEARLASMSPSDLELRIAVYDSPGHIRLIGHVGDDLTWADGGASVRIPFRIELDPSTLVDTIAAFTDLVANDR